MNERRRDFVMAFAGAAVLLAVDLLTMRACARPETWNAAASETRALIDAVKAMGGGAHPVASSEITLTAPDVAGEGALMHFTVASNVPDTRNIAILVEKHPNVLAANFAIAHGTEPWVHGRVKLAETSNVIALVKAADGKFYYASREVKVAPGGVGGEGSQSDKVGR